MRHAPDTIAEARSPGLQARLLDQAARLVRMGAWECDLADERLTWTEGVYDLFGLAPGDALKRSAIADRYLGASRIEMETVRAEAIRSGRGFVLDSRIRTFRGEERWIRISAEVACEAGRPVRLFGAKQDVTAEREALARLRERADTDPLTGLANRGLFDARCRELAGAGPCALVLIDLDHFKRINDRHGHAAGDACLREAGSRLRQAFPEAALVARIGGDEFAVLVGAPLGRAGLAARLARAVRALGRPVFWDGTRLETGASIGAALAGGPARRRAATPSALFAEADAALYAAKAAGRNAVRIFGEPEPDLRAGLTG
ncbi:GGDEF domain-containing protein [Methylobacterium nigriterrae]|uniref:GGDEF domain-containing protein n=1 Tax=Methylobacterium nigriterrae TaxID=3127512 RepID=UPI00301351F1